MLETQYLSTPLYSVSKNITFSTSDDIDMKLRPVTKTGNRNKKQTEFYLTLVLLFNVSYWSLKDIFKNPLPLGIIHTQTFSKN